MKFKWRMIKNMAEKINTPTFKLPAEMADRLNTLKEDVDKAQAIAEELDTMALYSDRCFSKEEYAALVADAGEHDVVCFVTPEAVKEFTDHVKKMKVGELNEFFTSKYNIVGKMLVPHSLVNFNQFFTVFSGVNSSWRNW